LIIFYFIFPFRNPKALHLFDHQIHHHSHHNRQNFN
jgi:hypothetical protein